MHFLSDPRVLERILTGNSIIGVVSEHAADQVFAGLRPLNPYIFYLLIKVVRITPQINKSKHQMPIESSKYSPKAYI